MALQLNKKEGNFRVAQYYYFQVEMGRGVSSVDSENLSDEDDDFLDDDTGETHALPNSDTSMGDSSVSVKKIKLTDLVETVKTAIDDNLTPLIVDPSEDHKVDTFYSYGDAVLLDGKKMSLDQSMRKIPVPELMEEARQKLVNCLKYGKILVVACTKSVTDFATTFNDEAAEGSGLDLQKRTLAYFPKEVFTRGGKGLLEQEKIDSLFRDEDTKDQAGCAVSRNPDGFFTVITSSFQFEDYEEYLFGNDWGLPKPISQYQVILISEEE